MIQLDQIIVDLFQLNGGFPGGQTIISINGANYLIAGGGGGCSSNQIYGSARVFSASTSYAVGVYNPANTAIVSDSSQIILATQGAKTETMNNTDGDYANPTTETPGTCGNNFRSSSMNTGSIASSYLSTYNSLSANETGQKSGTNRDGQIIITWLGGNEKFAPSSTHSH